MGAFRIQAVTTPRDRQLFLDVPRTVYRDDPHWVAPLRGSVARKIAPDGPFWQYGELQPFVALQSTSRGEKPVGRVVAAVNRRLNEREGRSVGLFGFFECVDDLSIGRALLEKSCDWLRDRGSTFARGPIDLSTHNNCLFQIDGFGSDPFLMMPYNPPYYPTLMERDGWRKAKDAFAYLLDLSKPLPPTFERAYRIASRSGVTFRPIRLKGEDFDRDCRQLYNLFTKAFTDNWSSNARTEAEFLEEARDLRQIVDPDIFPIAECEGEAIGFFMALPDYNIALKHARGKLDPLGLLRVWWHGRHIDRARVLAFCSLPEYLNKRVALAVIYLGMQGNERKGLPYKEAELSWVWEDNDASRRAIEATGCKHYKTFRMYEKDL